MSGSKRSIYVLRISFELPRMNLWLHGVRDVSDFEYSRPGELPIDLGDGLNRDARLSTLLGWLALLVGLATAAGAAYIGLSASTRLVSLPGGLPPANAETVAIVIFACGAITMMMGVIRIARTHGA
jgi:hypothetical protein